MCRSDPIVLCFYYSFDLDFSCYIKLFIFLFIVYWRNYKINLILAQGKFA